MNLDQIVQENKPQPTTPAQIPDDPFASPQLIKQSTAAPEEEGDEFDEFVVEKVKAVTELILSNCAEDRAKATDVINRIETIITSQHQVIQGGTVSRLLQAIQTRADINTTAVKMMEACGKILSARKGGTKTTITNTNAPTSTSSTLINILQEGLDKMGPQK
jgi:hypothetical protein